MSILVVGISHRTAPVEVLERLTLDASGVDKLIARTSEMEHVSETTVLSTCNRLEVYTDVDRFHGSVEEISRLLLGHEADEPVDAELIGNLYVHYGDAAVSHLFHVASGLDSMVVGEGQILGQTREALRIGQEHGTVGASLNVLFQQALRVGKRSHAETDIDHAAPSLVSAALDLVGSIEGRRAVVVGAGAMASLAVSTLSRRGAGLVTVLNRTESAAQRLAAEYDGEARPIDELGEVLADADLVISCTGASGAVITAEQVAAVRGGSTRPVTLIDLALPHDIEWAVGDLPGVTLKNLSTLAEELHDVAGLQSVTGVRAIVSEEIAAFLNARRQASVTPTVVALRSMATSVVDAEIERLLTRLPGLDPAHRDEVEQAIRRVADKLLHRPTTRVRELADETGAVSYATALAELFALDPDAVDAVTRPGGGR
ncbi:glutamyl-tRNA reductase [Nocardioides sp. Bht2]|uniref:glutamyl-tRNA reductase n=1 Tax=Nocardioides sp. Bht2 TaxID=3392297 RepID=UPI0039B573EF